RRGQCALDQFTTTDHARFCNSHQRALFMYTAPASYKTIAGSTSIRIAVNSSMQRRQYRTTRRRLICTVASVAARAAAATVAQRWPSSVTATCGNVAVRIDGPKMWTLSRIEYRGTRLGIEESAWGTVLNFPEVGFVGSAHRDGGAEEVHAVEFYL